MFLRLSNCESFIVIAFVISNIKESKTNTKLDEFILCGLIVALKPNVWITVVTGKQRLGMIFCLGSGIFNKL